MDLTVVLLQKNLRLIDNPALVWAEDRQKPLLIVYVPEKQNGVGHTWWKDRSLQAFAHDLSGMEMPLVVYEGDVTDLYISLKERVERIFFGWNEEDAGWEKKIGDAEIFEGNYLFDVRRIKKAYQRYTPYCNYVMSIPISKPLKKVVFSKKHRPPSSLIEDFSLYKKEELESHFSDYWIPGEYEAQKRWSAFLSKKIMSYDVARDFPAEEGISMLSASLHFGEISVRQIWHDLQGQKNSAGKTRYTQELIWREFCHQLLYNFPHMCKFPLQEKYLNFWWETRSDLFELWKKGKTGIPIVDAGMRELFQTGFMHNRVRMITASFLTKQLGITWQKGASWFMERLVDADFAQNYANWQWVAGCGADAAPFFRIFNPLLQAKKFDPSALYIKRWVPELKNLSVEEILSPRQSFERAKIGYDDQIVDVVEHREIALSHFKSMNKKK